MTDTVHRDPDCGCAFCVPFATPIANRELRLQESLINKHCEPMGDESAPLDHHRVGSCSRPVASPARTDLINEPDDDVAGDSNAVVYHSRQPTTALHDCARPNRRQKCRWITSREMTANSSSQLADTQRFGFSSARKLQNRGFARETTARRTAQSPRVRRSRWCLQYGTKAWSRQRTPA